MGVLTKKYRLFWTTETNEIINDYENDFSGSVTEYPDNSPNSYFESDSYEDILIEIRIDGLIKKKI